MLKRVTVPAVGQLDFKGATAGECRGVDLRPMGWEEMAALVGRGPSSASYQVKGYAEDGTALIEVETEDAAWLDALDAALSKPEHDLPTKAREMRDAYMGGAGFIDATIPEVRL